MKFLSHTKSFVTFYFLALLGVSSLASLQAEPPLNPTWAADSLWTEFIWTKGRYSLQTEDGYPTADFYCLFLNNNRWSLYDFGIFGLFATDYYFDTHLMKSSKSTIIRSRDTKTGLYHYTPRPGCEKQTIDYVEGWYAQRDFLNWSNLWKSAPSVSDIYSYVEAQLKLKTANQGKALPEEELSQAKQIKATIENKFSQAMLADLRHSFNLNQNDGHPIGDTFDYLDRLIDKFLKRPNQEITFTLVEEYLTTNDFCSGFQVKGNPIMKLSYNQETDCDTVTLAEGISPDDHLPFIILNSTELPCVFGE